MDDNTIKTIVAIAAITAIEITALLMKINGQIMSFVVAAIAGLGGYLIAKYLERKAV